MERRTSTLDALVAQLQQQHGSHAARRGDRLPLPAALVALPTGYPTFDAVLPGGGLPRGGLTELVGPRSAGATTLALAVIAQAQAAGDLACLLDLNGSFAPDAAAGPGVDLADLAIARPTDGIEAALIVHTLLTRRAVGVLVVDSLPRWLALPRGAAALAALLRPLPRLLAGSGCMMLVLNPVPTGLLADPALAPSGSLTPVTALRLRLAHSSWVRRGPSIIGSQTRVTVLAPPFSEPTAHTTIELTFARGEAQP